MTDLSSFHHPVTKIFETGDDPSHFELSADQLDQFTTQGFVTGITVLNRSQIDILRQELAELMKPEQQTNPLFYEYHHNESADPQKILFHALGAWRVSPAFHDIAFHKAVTVPARQILGGAVRFWHDQVFVKPARDGAVVSWHQDYSYWTRTTPMAHLTCWIGLDDASEENGCLHYVPGSHKWDLLPRTDLANDMNAILDKLSPERRAAFVPVPINLRAGEASFHHPLMVHGSFENRSDRPRRAIVINFVRDGVSSNSPDALLKGVNPVAVGKPLTGRYFPLLLE